MTTALVSPLSQFFDKSGAPLSGGYVYVGTTLLNPETAPIAVYWDSALTQPAALPLRTLNGFVVRNGTPSQVYASGDYSVTIKDARGALVLYEQSSAAYNVGLQVIALSADLANVIRDRKSVL